MREKPTLPRSELQVMKVIWQKGEASVRDVWEVLYPEKKLAYTSIASTMRKLEEKGFLTHEIRGRTYIYRPLIGEEEVSKGMVKDLIDRLFEGSAERLLMTLVEAKKIDEEALERIRRKISGAREREGG